MESGQAREILKRDGILEFHMETDSMMPLVEPGRDVAVVVPLHRRSVRKYDVVLFMRNDNSLTLGRVMGSNRHGYYICGDNSRRNVHRGVKSYAILGILQMVKHPDGSVTNVSGIMGRMQAILTGLIRKLKPLLGKSRRHHRAKKYHHKHHHSLWRKFVHRVRKIRFRMHRDIVLMGGVTGAIKRIARDHGGGSKHFKARQTKTLWRDLWHIIQPAEARIQKQKKGELPKELTTTHQLKEKLAVNFELPRTFSLRAYCLVVYVILSVKIIMSTSWLAYFFVYATEGSSAIYMTNFMFTITWIPLILFFIAYYFHLNKFLKMSIEKITLIAGYVSLARTGMFFYRMCSALDVNLVTVFNFADVVVWICITCFFFGVNYKMSGRKTFIAPIWKTLFREKRHHDARKRRLREFQSGTGKEEHTVVE